MPVSFIEHDGKKIFYVEYEPNSNKQHSLEQLTRYSNEVRKLKEPVLALSNVTHLVESVEFMRRSKELGPLFKEKAIKSAIYGGINGLKRLFLNGYNRATGDKMRAFETKEEALDWLTND